MCALNRCFIVVFMAMMTLPLIFVDLSSDRVSVKENRMLAKFPNLTDLKHHQGQFIRDFDAWFKDSTGFREQLLTLYNVVDKNKWLNNRVYYEDGQYAYIVGEKGHHYFADVGGRLISVFQGKQFLSDYLLKEMSNKLETVKIYLDKKGIPLIFMILASKESIYPEYYSKTIKRGPEPIQLDVITNYLKEHTSVDVFNIRQALITEKDNYLMYPVSSGDLSHYTGIAAFFAYRELMKHINIHFPQIKPYELNDIDIETNVSWPSLKSEITYKKLAPSFFDDIDLERPFTWENVIFENTKSDFPVILLLRDSFAEEGFFGKYIAQQFGRAIFIHYSNMKNLQDIIDNYKPDIVVFEVIEYRLDSIANGIISIPDIVVPPPSHCMEVQ
jgi:hypothetical protein